MPRPARRPGAHVTRGHYLSVWEPVPATALTGAFKRATTTGTLLAIQTEPLVWTMFLVGVGSR